MTQGYTKRAKRKNKKPNKQGKCFKLCHSIVKHSLKFDNLFLFFFLVCAKIEITNICTWIYLDFVSFRLVSYRFILSTYFRSFFHIHLICFYFDRPNWFSAPGWIVPRESKSKSRKQNTENVRPNIWHLESRLEAAAGL